MPGLHSGSGTRRIRAERLRQIKEEGWTPEHDYDHGLGTMAHAGFLYSISYINSDTPVPEAWPWDDKWWKPSDDKVRNLEKAGALVQAEIDRLVRLRGELAEKIDDLLDEGPDVQIR